MNNDLRLRIAVCDDDQTDLEQIVRATAQILDRANLNCKISEYNNSKELLEDIQNGKGYHILLLDVVMDELNGMKLAEKIRGMQDNSDIIFISVDRDMAVNGYEVAAARYLVKPLDPKKLQEALMYCIGLRQNKKEILFPACGGGYRISLSDIQFVEAIGRGTRLVLANDNAVECSLRFNEVEELLPKSVFYLCHRSYLINLSYIKSICRYEFSLHTGLMVPIAKARYMEAYRRFSGYLSN